MNIEHIDELLTDAFSELEILETLLNDIHYSIEPLREERLRRALLALDLIGGGNVINSIINELQEEFKKTEN